MCSCTSEDVSKDASILYCNQRFQFVLVTEVSVEKGDAVTLKCDTGLQNPNSVEWFKDDDTFLVMNGLRVCYLHEQFFFLLNSIIFYKDI